MVSRVRALAIEEATIADIHTAYRAGTRTVHAVTAACLARIAAYDKIGSGTDTGGAVRMPAAHNALVGLRPTVGLVSRTGVVPLDGVRDTAGPMARSVTDMTRLLEVIVGPDPADAATARSAGHMPPSYLPFLKKDGLTMVRLGVLRQVFPPQVTDARIIAHFAQTIAELKAAGAEIVDPLLVPRTRYDTASATDQRPI